MFTCFLLLILVVNCALQVQTIETSCFSIYSEDNKELESLTWAVGVPNITVVISSSGERSNFLLRFISRFYFKKSGISTLFATVRPRRVETDNSTLVNISSYNVSGGNFTFTVTFLRPDLIDGHNTSMTSCCCDSETSSPIQVKYCPMPDNDVQSTAVLNTKFQYNDIALLRCKNTVFVDKLTGIVSGRTAHIRCGGNAQWIGPKCWDGSFIDMTKSNPVQTFTQGVKVLIYCDVINQTMTNVAIQGSNEIYYNDTMMAWYYTKLSNADNNRIVTCYQSSITSQQSYRRSVKLNILYPPIVDKVYQRSILLYQGGYVEIGFKSNPPITGLNAVTVTKHGKKVENIYKKYDDHLNKVVIHFINASPSDLGEYNVMIKSGPPFHTSQHFLVRVSARTTNPPAISTRLYRATSAVPPPQANTSVPLSSLLLVTILLIISLVILIIGAIKYFRVLCFKGKPKVDEPSVRFDKEIDLPDQSKNAAYYEVPVVGNPYLPNPSQGFGSQGSNYQNTSVGSKYPQEEESAYDSI